jgi:hypothetical protein
LFEPRDFIPATIFQQIGNQLRAAFFFAPNRGVQFDQEAEIRTQKIPAQLAQDYVRLL